MASNNIKTFTQDNFEADVLNSSSVTLVDFWAPWCGPCKAIAPMLDELADEMGEKATIGKVNVDENSELAGKYNVRAIPTLIIVKGGEVVDQVVGMTNKAELKEKLEGQL